MQFFRADVIRAPPQWPPFGVSLSRDVRASEPATSCTPDSRAQGRRVTRGRCVAWSYSTTMSSLTGSRSAANVVLRGVGGPGAGADRVPGVGDRAGPNGSCARRFDHLLAGRGDVAGHRGLVLLRVQLRAVHHDLVAGRGGADHADDALAQPVRQSGRRPAGGVQRLEGADGGGDAFAERLAERARIGRADVGCASRVDSAELALGCACEHAARPGQRSASAAAVAVRPTAKSETEPSASSGTVAESRTELPRSVDGLRKSSGQGLRSVNSRSPSASKFDYRARAYLASSRPSAPKNCSVSASAAIRLAACSTPVCGTLSQPTRRCGADRGAELAALADA